SAATRPDLEGRLGTAEDAGRAERLRSAFRLSGWRVRKPDMRSSGGSIFLRRAVRGPLRSLAPATMRAVLFLILTIGGANSAAFADVIHCYCHGADACAQKHRLRGEPLCEAS